VPVTGAAYGPSKAYVIALSEELSQSFAGTNVRVSALCPGFVHTEFHDTPQLAEAKAGTPGWLWYSAEQVVRDGIAGVSRGAPIVISGRLYRWLDLLLLQGWTRPAVRYLTRAKSLNWKSPDN
jgi:short-subunit dehydrogenase